MQQTPVTTATPDPTITRETRPSYEFYSAISLIQCQAGVERPPREVSTHLWQKHRQKPLGPINYDKGAPRSYRCLCCRAYGVKLFRLFNNFRDANDTICADCAEREQGPQYAVARFWRGGRENIGWRIPAVPTPDGKDFWVYPAMMVQGINWWHSLPDRPTLKGKANGPQRRDRTAAATAQPTEGGAE